MHEFLRKTIKWNPHIYLPLLRFSNLLFVTLTLNYLSTTTDKHCSCDTDTSQLISWSPKQPTPLQRTLPNETNLAPSYSSQKLPHPNFHPSTYLPLINLLSYFPTPQFPTPSKQPHPNETSPHVSQQTTLMTNRQTYTQRTPLSHLPQLFTLQNHNTGDQKPSNQLIKRYFPELLST